MSQFLQGTSKRTAARKAGHADRLAQRWAGHVPPIEIWRGDNDAATSRSSRHTSDNSVGDLPGGIDSGEPDSALDNATREVKS